MNSKNKLNDGVFGSLSDAYSQLDKDHKAFGSSSGRGKTGKIKS